MNKSKLKRIIFIVLVILVIFIFLMFYIDKKYTYANVINYNWGTDIATSTKEEYYTDTGPSFHGDGERYSVFPKLKLNMKLDNSKNNDLENKIDVLNKKIQIESKEQINFDHKYGWTMIVDKSDKRNKLYIIYDYMVDKCYFYEDIS